VVERGLGFSLPPAELVRRDSVLFGEVKCLFSTTPEVGKETEANGGHSGDRTLHRTRSRFDRTRPVISTQRGYVTGCWSGLTSASGQFTCAQKKRARDRRVRSLTEPARPVMRPKGQSAVE
jgi:hypothetical protein